MRSLDDQDVRRGPACTLALANFNPTGTDVWMALDDKSRHATVSSVRYASNAPLSAAVVWRALAIWLPIAVATTGLAGIVYVTAQQSLRIGADDPQIALARQTVARLNGGAAPASVVPEQVDLAASIDPFVLVLDADNRLLVSSILLHGQPPNYPEGVLDTVALPWHGGFVVAGRSLELTEQHIDQVGVLVGAGLLATLGLVAVAALLAALLSPLLVRPTDRFGPSRIPHVASPGTT